MASGDGTRWYMHHILFRRAANSLTTIHPVEDGTFPFYRSEDIAEERCEF